MEGHRRTLSSAFIVLMLSGCIGPQVQTMRLSTAVSHELRETIRIYNRADLQNVTFERLGVVSAVSCQNKFWDSASEEDALNQLLYKASLAGGTGVTDVSCESEGTNVAKNCWSSYTCHGGIIKVPVATQRDAQGWAATAAGSGIVVSGDGHILTNSHVVSGAKHIKITMGVEILDAVLLREDAQNDLALLKVDKQTVPLAFRDDNRVRAGDTVIVIGFPLSTILSREPHVSTGNVTAVAGVKDDIRFLQVSAPVQPGNSGGPVLDDAGRVIGVTVAQIDALKVAFATGSVPQNVNFAIKGAIAKTFMDAAGITFEIAEETAPRPVPDIAEATRSSVVYIESR